MATQCVTKVELTVSCKNLLDKDVGSKSDPLCVLLQSVGDDKWTEVRDSLSLSSFNFLYFSCTADASQCLLFQLHSVIVEKWNINNNYTVGITVQLHV